MSLNVISCSTDRKGKSNTLSANIISVKLAAVSAIFIERKGVLGSVAAKSRQYGLTVTSEPFCTSIGNW